MHMTVDWKTLLSLPSAYGADTPVEVGGDFLPRLETVSGCVSQWCLLQDMAKEGQGRPEMPWPSMTIGGSSERA